MRKRQQWPQAVERLRNLAGSRGDGPHRAAEAYGEVYRGRRGAMVFDVVVSRQRKYHSVVLPRVEKWAAAGDRSLARLAQREMQAEQFGLQRTEPVPLQTVAANLLGFCRDQGLSEDEGCRAWADGVQDLAGTLASWGSTCPVMNIPSWCGAGGGGRAWRQPARPRSAAVGPRRVILTGQSHMYEPLP